MKKYQVQSKFKAGDRVYFLWDLEDGIVCEGIIYGVVFTMREGSPIPTLVQYQIDCDTINNVMSTTLECYAFKTLDALKKYFSNVSLTQLKIVPVD